MEVPTFTLYFRGFSEECSNEDLENIFSEFGNINKLFIHKSRTYGMVEFDDISSCTDAISSLHCKPPHNLFVNMAKNQPVDKKEPNAKTSLGNNTITPNRYKRYEEKNNTDSIVDEIIYIEEDVYVDEYNQPVNIFVDPSTNEVYVPITYATNIRRIIKKVPQRVKDLVQDGYFFNQSENGNMDDECMSQTSNQSGRKIKIDENSHSIKIERSFQNQNESHMDDSFLQQRNSGQFGEHRKNNYYKKSYKENFQNKQSLGGPNENRYQNKKFQNNYIRDTEPTQGSSSTHFNKYNNDKQQKPYGRHSFNKQNTNKADDWDTTANIQSDAVLNSKPEVVSPEKVVTPSKQEAAPSVAPISNRLKPKTKKDSYTTYELPKDQFTEVKVETPISDTVGWVHICDKMTILNDILTDTLNEKDSAAPLTPEVGKLCLALYEDYWYRAVILTTSPKIRVRFIDFGNESDVTETEIWELSSSLSATPSHALLIELADGAPCKIKSELVLKVKPVTIENGKITVQVENGIYGKEINKSSFTEPKHMLDVFALQLFSQLKAEQIGYLTLSIELSKTKYVAYFLPGDLDDQLAKLHNVVPKTDSTNKVNIGDIACAENEDGWNRVYILDIAQNSYKVAFIDYGSIANVSEIRPLPVELITVPQFSCVCSFDEIYSEKLSKIKGELINFVITKVTNKKIICILSYESEPICEVECIVWDPRIHLPNSNEKQANIVNIPTVKSPPCVKEEIIPVLKTPKQIALNNGDDVKLVTESEGFLYVRTKQASEVLKKIERYMAENGSKAPKIHEKPVVGQFVAAEYDNGWYRAVVQSINNNNATILYIDYGNEEIKPIFSLKELDDEICKEPIAIIKIKLQNYLNKTFSPKALAYFQKLADTKTLLKATYINSMKDGVNLTTKEGIIVSDELVKIDRTVSNLKSGSSNSLNLKSGSSNSLNLKSVPSGKQFNKIKIPGNDDPKIMSIPLQEIPFGITDIIFQECSDLSSRMISICTNNPKFLHEVHVDLQSQMTNYAEHVVQDKSYHPEPEEYVLARNGGKWYRAVCTDTNDKFSLFFIDYGFYDDLPAEQIRRMPCEFAKTKALANFAFIHGIPETPNEALIEKLSGLLEKNNMYQVNVLEKSDDESYIIAIPSVLEVLRKGNFI